MPDREHLSEQLFVPNWNLPSVQERSEKFARRLSQLIELRDAINAIVGAVHRYESTPTLLREDAELWLATLDAILDCDDPSLWPTAAARRELFELCNHIARKLERISSVLLIPLEQHIRPIALQLDAIVSLQQQYFPVVSREQHFREIDLLEQISELRDYVLCSTENLNRRLNKTTSETPQKPTVETLAIDQQGKNKGTKTGTVTGDNVERVKKFVTEYQSKNNGIDPTQQAAQRATKLGSSKISLIFQQLREEKILSGPGRVKRHP